MFLVLSPVSEGQKEEQSAAESCGGGSTLSTRLQLNKGLCWLISKLYQQGEVKAPPSLLLEGGGLQNTRGLSAGLLSLLLSNTGDNTKNMFVALKTLW